MLHSLSTKIKDLSYLNYNKKITPVRKNLHCFLQNNYKYLPSLTSHPPNNKTFIYNWKIMCLLKELWDNFLSNVLFSSKHTTAL